MGRDSDVVGGEQLIRRKLRKQEHTFKQGDIRVRGWKVKYGFRTAKPLQEVGF